MYTQVQVKSPDDEGEDPASGLSTEIAAYPCDSATGLKIIVIAAAGLCKLRVWCSSRCKAHSSCCESFCLYGSCLRSLAQLQARKGLRHAPHLPRPETDAMSSMTHGTGHSRHADMSGHPQIDSSAAQTPVLA